MSTVPCWSKSVLGKDEYRRFSEINREISRLQIRESIAGRWFRMVIQIFTHLGPVLILLWWVSVHPGRVDSRAIVTLWRSCTASTVQSGNLPVSILRYPVPWLCLNGFLNTWI